MADDIVTEAKKRFQRAKDFYGPSRVLAVADTRFALGDSDNGWQWPDDIAQERTIARRVKLTVNTTAQHCNQVINEIRKNRPACKVSPVDGGADKKTADILAGLIRNIQASSNADDAHDIAAEHATYGGEGYWRIKTDYESETSFDQCIQVCPIPNPCRVYIDPDAKELDKSDAEWGFIFTDCSKEQFKREYPEIDPASWIDDRSGWINGDSFVKAEYFHCTYTKDTACQYVGPDGSMESALKSDSAKLDKLMQAGFVQAYDDKGKPKERPTQVKQWKHCMIVGGHDKPLDETDWAGDYLPIVSVVGKEVNVNGEIVRKGLVRDLKDPARIVNYAYSETVQTLALQNKIPYIAAAEAIEGHENQWRGANMSNDAYLPYNAYDGNGQPLPAPKRQDPAVMPAAQINLLQLSLEQMRGSSGQQNANFGIKSEAASGIGIQRLKVQGEVATFHFPDNLARSLKYEAKLLIDLIPKIYTKEKVLRILGVDGTTQMATLAPDMPGAYVEVPSGEDIQRIFNPGVGRYDVAIDTGPSFQTQRQESQAVMVELARSDPSLMQKAGDIVVRSMDFQDADKLADRLAKTLPPGLADDKGGPAKQVAQLTQQLQQMQQESQMHIQEGMKLEEENQSLKAGEQSKMMEAQAAAMKAQQDAQLQAQRIEADKEAAMEKARADAQIAKYKADLEANTKKWVALLNTRTEKELAGLEAQVQLAGMEMSAQTGKGLQGESMEVEEPEMPQEEPEKPSRKTITIQAPSGAVYTGVIEES
jgi:hypothetical protein